MRKPSKRWWQFIAEAPRSASSVHPSAQPPARKRYLASSAAGAFYSRFRVRGSWTQSLFFALHKTIQTVPNRNTAFWNPLK